MQFNVYSRQFQNNKDWPTYLQMAYCAHTRAPQPKKYGKTFPKMEMKQKHTDTHIRGAVIFTEGELMKLVKRVSCQFSVGVCVCVCLLKEIASEI